MESILTSIKKLLGIAEEYDHFDADLIMHINSVFSTLTQIGVGPKDGFRIEDETAEWSDFMEGRTDIESVKSYIHNKVKLMFDPPSAGAEMEARKEIIRELEWRLSITADNKREE